MAADDMNKTSDTFLSKFRKEFLNIWTNLND